MYSQAPRWGRAQRVPCPATWLCILEDVPVCPVCTAQKYYQEGMTRQREIAEPSYIATRGRCSVLALSHRFSLVMSWHIWVGVLVVSENCLSKCPHLLIFYEVGDGIRDEYAMPRGVTSSCFPFYVSRPTKISWKCALVLSNFLAFVPFLHF